MPILVELLKPKQLIGWLEGFKSYNGIRKRKQYGEAALVNMESVKDCMIELRKIIAPYLLKDVYNIDKTGLYWKAILDIILVTKL